jgi:hypothetical protein
MTNESKHDGRTDFDFLIGSWNIQHRRLKERLKGCTEWEEFEGTDSNPGRLDVPMVGKFDGGRGEFFSQELFEGRHIFSRFIWTVNGPDACHWEQAFSADGGKTWEINWTMTFTRQR